MSSSGRAGQPAQPAAEAEATSNGGQPAGGPASRGTPGTDPQASAGAVPAPPRGQTAEAMTAADSQPAAEERPVDKAGLRQEIERTREQLGETVEQLAAKTDVQGRARAKAAELAGRAKGTTAQARTQAAAQFGNVRGQLQARAAPAREAIPEPLRRAVAKGASTAQQRRVPLATAAVTLIAGYLAFRWWRRR